MQGRDLLFWSLACDTGNMGRSKFHLFQSMLLASCRAFREFRDQEALPLLSVFSATSLVISSSLRRAQRKPEEC